MRRDNEQRPLAGAPSHPNNSTPRQKDHTENSSELEQLVATLHARWPEIPVAKLRSPTLGAWQRANGVTGPCDEARVLLAVEIVHEAQRRILLERLDSIMEYLAVGATPDQAMARVRRLVVDYDARPMETAA
jgi:hypothetical protein